MSEDDPLYRLTSAGLDTFITALYDRKNDVYDRLHILIENKDFYRLLALNPMCHKVCKIIYTHKRSGQIDKVKRLKVSAKDLSGANVPDFQSCCFICGKDRDLKGARDMCTVSTQTRSDAIYRKASELQDAFILANITNKNYGQINLAANKYRYHRFCMDGLLNRKMQ